MSNLNVSFVKLPNGIAITILRDGKAYSSNVMDDHRNYDKVMEAMRTKNYDALPGLMDPGTAVNDFVAKADDTYKGRIAFANGAVMYNGVPLHNTITQRIVEQQQEGYDPNPLMRFLDNLMDNPSKTAVTELYGFLEKSELPITEDGCFLAYKKVRGDYTSIHASPDGTHMDHRIGSAPEMPRNEVDDNRDVTCSTGLHFCSKSYLPEFGSYSNKVGPDRIVILKINPKDVVSIPSDYNEAKGRACRYEVVAEYTGDELKAEEAFTSRVYAADKDTGMKPVPGKVAAPAARGVDGRFVSRKDSAPKVGDVYTINEAATKLGLTASAVKKRAQRGVSLAFAGQGTVVVRKLD